MSSIKIITRSQIIVQPKNAEELFARGANFAEELFETKCYLREIQIEAKCEKGAKNWGMFYPASKSLTIKSMPYRHITNFYENSFEGKQYTKKRWMALLVSFRLLLHELAHSTDKYSRSKYASKGIGRGYYSWFLAFEEGTAEWAAEYFLLDFLHFIGADKINADITRIHPRLKLGSGGKYNGYAVAFDKFTTAFSKRVGCEVNQLKWAILKSGRGFTTLIQLALLDINGLDSNPNLNLNLTSEKAFKIFIENRKAEKLYHHYIRQLQRVAAESTKKMKNYGGLSPNRTYIKFPELADLNL